MLTLLSPAKTLDLDTPAFSTHTQPEFLKSAQLLNTELRDYSVTKLQKLMGLSEKLATLNVNRNQAWKPPFTTQNARSAIRAFQGEVYVRLDAKTFTQADLAFAQDHLRILSGLYGLLRPLDLMQAYRLEMGTSLKTEAGKGLYAFWGDSITQSLNNSLAEEKNPVVINLASNEYSKAITRKTLSAQLITPVFKEKKGDGYKVIAILAKRARGLMARHIIKKKLKTPAGLKKFSTDGYAYQPSLSTETEWVFTRD